MAATYILPLDLVTFYDSNRVLELLTDDDDPAALVDLSNVASGPYIRALNAITVAASTLDSHCQMGKRYTRANLEAIIAAYVAAPTDAAKSKRAALIRQMVADQAFGLLMSRRGFTGEQMREMAPRYDESLRLLDKLASGHMVFDLDANVNAGVPSSVSIGQNVYRPGSDNPMFGVWCDFPYNRNNLGYFFGG